MPMVEQRLAAMGLLLPQPWALPPGITVPASLVLVRGKRVLVSGHVPTDALGAVAGPFGRIGAEVTAEQGFEAARASLLAILASLKAALGDLDRIGAWLRLVGMVQAVPGFTAFPIVMNGASAVVAEAFGPEVGDHARVAMGVAGLPFNVPVEIEAEVELS